MLNKRGMAKLDLWGSILLVVLVVIAGSMVIGFKTTNENINSLAEVAAAQSPQIALAPRTPDYGSIGPATHKECINRQCVVVAGKGPNQCNTNANCQPEVESYFLFQ